MEEDIEIIMNWNYSGIARNVPSKNRRGVLGAIYGISEDEVDREFPDTFTIKDYLEKYLEKLRQYFRFVNTIGVPRKRKIQPKMSKYREYFLIHCSNNESAKFISLNKVKKLSRIVEYEDLFEKWGGINKSQASP
jgi:hypothetical protein